VDHVEHEDTGQDTGVQECEDEGPIISAAEQAGEQGGISCQASPVQYNNWSLVLGLFLGMLIVLRRKR